MLSRRRTDDRGNSRTVEPLESRVMLTASPVGPQFKLAVSAEPYVGYLSEQSVASDANGAFVAVWSEYGVAPQDPDGSDVYARRFDATGAPLGPAFRVNQVGEFNQSSPVIAMTPAGDFVIAWHTEGAPSILAQRFSAAGQRVGPEFSVNEVSTLWVSAPRIGMNAVGEFVVAWSRADGAGDTEDDIYARKFAADATPAGGEFRVNTFVDSSQNGAHVAVAADGGYAVGWVTREPDLGPFMHGIRVRRFSPDSTPLGGEITISSGSVHFSPPQIGVGADGRYLVAYDEQARYLGVDGALDGPGFRVPPPLDARGTVPDLASLPVLSMNAAGDAVFTWTGRLTTDDRPPFEYDVYAREVAAGGVLGDTLKVNTSRTAGDVGTTSAALDSDGDFVVMWVGELDDDVWGRRFDSPYSASRVTARQVFYNNSAFDAAAGPASDDAAIAPGKQAHLPSQPAASTQVTNYTKGLNGIMLDLARLPDGGSQPLGPDDFAVRSGPGLAPSTWKDGPRPARVSIRRGAGAGGSDRVTLVWPDYNPAEPSAAARAAQAVANGWLEITVRANERTGLWKPETFSFGNLVGDAGEGNLEQLASVGALDLAAVKRELGRPAALASRVDFNHDGRTNALDLAVARANLGKTLPMPFAAYPVAAYEGFDYAADGPLYGKDGGTGWMHPWFYYDDGVVRAGSLADPTGTLATTGNHLGGGGALRRLAEPFGQDYTEMWVSFLFRKPRGQAALDAGGLIIGNGVLGSGQAFFVGDPRGGASEDAIVIGEVGNDASYLSTGIAAGPETHLLVVRLQFVPGTERATLYVDPRPGVVPPTGGTTFYGLSISASTPFMGLISTVPSYDFDELRVGGSYEEVTPANTLAGGVAVLSPVDAQPVPLSFAIQKTVGDPTGMTSAPSALLSPADDKAGVLG